MTFSKTIDRTIKNREKFLYYLGSIINSVGEKTH